MPTNTTLTIDYNGGTPEFVPTPGPIDLYLHDTVTLVLANFPPPSSIGTVTFYGNGTKGGKDVKDEDDVLGSWQRGPGNDPSLNNKFSVTPEDGDETKVFIENLTVVPTSLDYIVNWFSVSGHANGTPWLEDPQLRVRPGLNVTS